MKTIYRYPLSLVDVQDVAFVEDADVLSVKEQDDRLVLFALGDPSRPVKHRKVWVCPTNGHPPDENDASFQSTVMLHDGLLVYHVFVEHNNDEVVF